MTSLVAPETIEAFRRDGAAVLRGVSSRTGSRRCERAIDRNLAEPSADVKIYQGKDGAGRFVGDYCNWDRIPEYKDFIFNSKAADIGRELMGTKTVRLFHEHVLVKEPGADVPTPWHQDQPYYCVDGSDTVSLWIPLDSVPRERTLEFVGGSHKWGKYYRPERFNKQALNENDGLEPVPDIDGNRDEVQHARLGAGAGRCGGLQLPHAPWGTRQQEQERAAPRLLAPPHGRQRALCPARGHQHVAAVPRRDARRMAR